MMVIISPRRIAIDTAITILCAFFAADTVNATTCTAFPTVLSNGNIADATQVMNDFNYLPTCLAPLASPSFTGNVGIGTSPSYALDVAAGGGAIVMRVNGRNGATSDNVQLRFAGQKDGDLWAIGSDIVLGGSTKDFEFFSMSANTTEMTITSGGNVGIGTITPTYTLQVNGSVAGTSAYNNLSDARLKRDIAPISDALATIEKIRGVRFHWRTSAERGVGKALNLPVAEPQVGFVAQELEAALPEAVSVAKGNDAIMSVQESKVVPVLVEAVKQLKAENDKLKTVNEQCNGN